MSNLPLKALPWEDHESGTASESRSALHEYEVWETADNTGWIVGYFDRRNPTGIKDATGFASMEDAKTWCWKHYNEKMQQYVKPESITDIANWFKAAKPEPTTNDICTQIGCHFEEVAEMHLSLGDSKMCHFVDQNANDYKKGYTNSIVGMMVREHGGLSKIELLDALCDQIVTATGVAYMMGFDIEGALKEVIRSNNSKMVDGRFEFDDNGKIMKPDSYSKPDLTPFVKQGE